MSAIADIVVTRAGATTVADLAAQSKACIIIPHPYLSGGHQLKNAQVYADAHAAVIVDESDMLKDPTLLHDAVSKLLHDPERQVALGNKLHNLSPVENTAEALAKILYEIAS